MNGIGKKIKDLIELQNITQRDLAEKVGCTEVSISRYISGERVPRSDILSKIANVLGVTMEYLAGTEKIDDYNSDRVLNQLKEEIIKSQKDMQVIKIYEKYKEYITPRELEEILEVVARTRKRNQKENNNQY